MKGGKIVLVLQNFPSDSPFLMAKYEGLKKSGMKVEMVCLEDRPCLWSFPFMALACLLKNPAGTLGYITKAVARWKAAFFKRFYLDAPVIAASPDLIHYEFGTLAVTREHLGPFLNCRQTVSFRGYDLNYAGLENPDYYASVWKNVDAVHLLGEDLWKRAKKRGCPSEKPHVLIPPAVDTDFFKMENRQHAEVAGTAQRPLRLVSVGRLVWKKGYEYALLAVRELQKSGMEIRYEIVGTGDYREAIAFAIHKMKLGACVRLAGNLTKQEIKTALESSDIFLHAAVSEGFCNAVIEAQSMQLPVVCTDADGLPENVEDGVSGFVVPRRNANLIAEKIRLLAKDPALRQKMGKAGRARVLDKFRIENQIAAFEKFYSKVLGGNI